MANGRALRTNRVRARAVTRLRGIKVRAREHPRRAKVISIYSRNTHNTHCDCSNATKQKSHRSRDRATRSATFILCGVCVRGPPRTQRFRCIYKYSRYIYIYTRYRVSQKCGGLLAFIAFRKNTREYRYHTHTHTHNFIYYNFGTWHTQNAQQTLCPHMHTIRAGRRVIRALAWCYIYGVYSLRGEQCVNPLCLGTLCGHTLYTAGM